MADYYSVLARAVMNLETDDGGAREELYERALPFVKRSSAASGETTFCGFGGVLSFAVMAGRLIKPAASADAVNVSALTASGGHHKRSGKSRTCLLRPVAGRDDISWRAM